MFSPGHAGASAYARVGVETGVMGASPHRLIDPVALDGLPAPEKAEEPDALLLGFESEKNRYERNLDYARTIARQDPKIVATVVKNWVSDER